MQGINRKADMVSIRISRETRDALSSIKYTGQSYDSIMRQLIGFMNEAIYTSGYDGWTLKALFPNRRYET
jgi:hypothetical protein